MTEHQLQEVQLPRVKAQEGKERALVPLQWWGIRKDMESSRTQDLHGVVLHGLPIFVGHNAAVRARVLFLGIQDLQPMATWAKWGATLESCHSQP